MVLVHASLGYTVCLECHEVCEGECSDAWLDEHTNHSGPGHEHTRTWWPWA